MRFLVNGEIVELGSSGVRTRKALDRIEDEGSEIGILDGLPAARACAVARGTISRSHVPGFSRRAE
jgi:hypothetical protein